MKLNVLIQNFLDNPFPLWEKGLTSLLVLREWEQLGRKGISSENYSIANCVLETVKHTNTITVLREPHIIALEHSSSNLLLAFYDEHGLMPLTDKQIKQVNAIQKLKEALDVLDSASGVLDCISTLVTSIQALRTDDPEIDISYSHPNIPFSIFVSVNGEVSSTSSLRIAEAILHESMHLKLSLIENYVTFFSLGEHLHYSPWRQCERPVRGVLHGLFVFRCIQEFYTVILDSKQYDLRCKQFIQHRIEDIKQELELLKDFTTDPGLTLIGQNFVSNLMQD